MLPLAPIPWLINRPCMLEERETLGERFWGEIRENFGEIKENSVCVSLGYGINNPGTLQELRNYLRQVLSP